MIEALFDGLFSAGAAVVTGGATGLLGTAVSGVIDYFQAKQRHAQEVQLRKLDITLAKTEASGAERVAAIEAETERAKADAEALAESYREAARRLTRPGETGLMVFADFVRSMTRPGLTWLHFLLVAAIYFFLAADDGISITAIRARIIDTVLFVYTASSLWWFGQRQIEKRRAAAAAGVM